MFEIRLQDTRVFREIREERTQEIALNMLRENLTVEMIAKLTGLTIEQVQQLQGQLEQT